MSDSAIHAAERDERKSALAAMSELERQQACGHHYVRAVCIYCGDAGADWSDA
jgi:hypothetical protein